MKKKIAAAAAMVLCLSLLAYGTIAYFTAEDTAVNVITAGNIKIQLQETMIPEDGGEPVAFHGPLESLPGRELSKIVQVKNTGEHPAYVRIALQKEILRVQEHPEEPDLSLVSLNINTTDWTETDGYYYYNKPLASGEITEPLFTTVSFAAEMDNAYQNSKTVIHIYAFGVQAENNGPHISETAGWPEIQ